MPIKSTQQSIGNIDLPHTGDQVTLFSILIADNHPIFRFGLKLLLSQVPKYKVIAETGIGREAVDLAKKNAPDLILLDMKVLKMDGIFVAKEILLDNPNAKIIALSDFSSDEEVVNAVNVGVKGILYKSQNDKQILEALEHVITGEEYFCKGAIEILINRCAKANQNYLKAATNTPIFSKRELEIIRLICEEKTAKEIGATIFISDKTVDFHRKNIIQKMDVRNIVGLVVHAIKNQIVNVYELG